MTRSTNNEVVRNTDVREDLLVAAYYRIRSCCDAHLREDLTREFPAAPAEGAEMKYCNRPDCPIQWDGQHTHNDDAQPGYVATMTPMTGAFQWAQPAQAVTDAAWRCAQCGELLDMVSAAWRWTGEVWQHWHADVGHVNARNFAERARSAQVEGVERPRAIFGYEVKDTTPSAGNSAEAVALWDKLEGYLADWLVQQYSIQIDPRTLADQLSKRIDDYPAKPAQGWLPIETAPKDQGSIVIWVPENQSQFLVTWDSTENRWSVFGGGWRTYLPNATLWRPRHPSPLAAGRAENLSQATPAPCAFGECDWSCVELGACK